MCSKKLLNESITSPAHPANTFRSASISEQLISKIIYTSSNCAKHAAHDFAWNVCLIHYSYHNWLDWMLP